MNSIVAIASAFLRGEVLTIKTAFRDFGVTNLPRECGRSIERKFGVVLDRKQKEGKSRFGVPCTWFEYRLRNSPTNEAGIAKMRVYIKKHTKSYTDCKTDKEIRELKQQEMFT